MGDAPNWVRASISSFRIFRSRSQLEGRNAPMESTSIVAALFSKVTRLRYHIHMHGTGNQSPAV
jgi:hypothetical protein